MVIIGADPGKHFAVAVLAGRKGEEMPSLVFRGETMVEDTAQLYNWLRERVVSLTLPWDGPVFVAVEQVFQAGGRMGGKDTLDAVEFTGILDYWSRCMGWGGLYRYAPGTVRRCVTGSGSSKDSQVNAAVRELFAIAKNPGKGSGLGQHQPQAIAVALAHWMGAENQRR